MWQLRARLIRCHLSFGSSASLNLSDRFFLRLIHARAEQTTLSERERKLIRPRRNFISPGTAGSYTKNDSGFVLHPTQLPGNRLTAHRRAALQRSESQDELLHNVEVAFEDGNVDISVIAAAMQRCGQGRWWSALEQVRGLQLAHGIALNSICVNVYLSALAKCVRGERGFGAVPERQVVVLELAHCALTELTTLESEQRGITLNVALALCVTACSMEGLQWGEELWAWSNRCCVCRSLVSYNNFVFLLEAHGKTKRVDEFLAEADKLSWAPDYTSLGGLINASAERRDWQRVEKLWLQLTTSFCVRPTHIQYTARIKAHLLCGRPSAVVDIVDEALSNGIQLQPQLVEALFQAQLIRYHSTLDQCDLDRLMQIGRTGTPIMESAAGSLRRTWSDLQFVFRRLCDSPTSVRFTDLLVTWKTRQSEMVSWNNHLAGANYLVRE